MKDTISYTELEKHFQAPKTVSAFYKFKRMPRKMKKEWKKYTMNGALINYEFLNINQKLWHMLGHTNPNYKRFLIKQVTMGNIE
jgi:hypothetical protein